MNRDMGVGTRRSRTEHKKQREVAPAALYLFALVWFQLLVERHSITVSRRLSYSPTLLSAQPYGEVACKHL